MNFFQCDRWKDLFLSTNGSDIQGGKMYMENGYWTVDLHTEFKDYDNEIDKFIDWINPYIVGRKKKQYIGKWKDEDMNNYINLYIERENNKLNHSELYNLWKKWHTKKYCEVSEDIKTNSLILFCNDICDRIEKEELDYIDELYEDDEYKESDIEDEKVIALKNHLEISNSEAIQDIKNDYDNIYTYGNKKYLVLTDDEADDYFDEYLDRYLDDVILPEIPEYLRYYFDDELWKRDVKMVERGSFLSTYNGEEHYETVNDLEYYIYRTN
jgi:hypothetical protein